MGNRPKYFEFVNTLRQSQLGEPARIRSIFHNETREKHEKQPKSSLTKARRARRNSHRIFFWGGNSRKQRAPPILLCVSVPLCETSSAVAGCGIRRERDFPSRLVGTRPRPAWRDGEPRLFLQISEEFLQPTATGGSFQIGFAPAGKRKCACFFEMHQMPRGSGACGRYAAGVVDVQPSLPILGATHVRALAGRAI